MGYGGTTILTNCSYLKKGVVTERKTRSSERTRRLLKTGRVLVKGVKIRESQGSSVGIATGHKQADRCSGVRFPAGAGNFFFSAASRPALGTTQPPIQLLSGSLSRG
jgi:hypothetical protein